MSRCEQEMCPHWDGDGDSCPCATFDLPRPSALRCRYGGSAPCDDDLCHGVDSTVCGVEINLLEPLS